MNKVIGLARVLVTLQERPDPAAYMALLQWIDKPDALQIIRNQLERELLSVVSHPPLSLSSAVTGQVTIEVPVQRLDSDDVLYYQTKSNERVIDLLKQVVEHESIPLRQIKCMLVKPDVVYWGQRISGQTQRLSNLGTPLGDIVGRGRLVIYPSTEGMLNWTESVDHQVVIRIRPRLQDVSISVDKTTTVGQLKRKLWPIVAVAPGEQLIATAESDDILLGDIQYITVDFKHYDIVIHDSRRDVTTHFRMNVTDGGDDVVYYLAINAGLNVTHLWLGSGADRLEVTDAPELLCNYLIPNPGTHLYMDTVDEED